MSDLVKSPAAELRLEKAKIKRRKSGYHQGWVRASQWKKSNTKRPTNRGLKL